MEATFDLPPPRAASRIFPWRVTPIAMADRRTVVPVCVGLLALTGVGDFVTGVDITFTLLYVLPIVLGTWVRGRRFGLALSSGAVAAGVLSSLASPDAHHSMGTIVWNQSGALGMFVLIAWLVGELRLFIEAEQQRCDDALSQLRHAERLNVIGTLAAGVAHELGTPLNVIMGNAERLDADPDASTRAHEASRAIQAQAGRMTQIISQLLDFGRRGGTDRRVLDLRSIVARSTSLLEPIAKRGKCSILFEPPAEPVVGYVNPSEIEQVLANLILNAVQAMPAGGVVRVGCESERVWTEPGTARPFGCITVQDEGTGIAPADLPRIFDPFFTTKGVGKGTGLGLSVSYGIVQDHGGTIHVSSELGKGARFVVFLPAYDEHARAD